VTKVAELSVKAVEVADPGDSVQQAARRMVEREIGTLVVVDDLRRPLGIVTDRDLMARCLAPGRDPRRTRLGDVMSNPVVWIHESADVAKALDDMTRLRVRRLPVIDNGQRLVGILALDDVIAHDFEGEPRALDALRALRATM
jgi:CBS domain-containing protein